MKKKKKVLKFTLPEWTDERHVWIIAGQEPVLFRQRFVGKDRKVRYRWFIKSGRCNLCGKCCMNLRSDWIWGVDSKGTCKRLVEGNPGEFYCDPNKGGMPWGCLKGDGRERVLECTVRYEEVNG